MPRRTVPFRRKPGPALNAVLAASPDFALGQAIRGAVLPANSRGLKWFAVAGEAHCLRLRLSALHPARDGLRPCLSATGSRRPSVPGGSGAYQVELDRNPTRRAGDEADPGDPFQSWAAPWAMRASVGRQFSTRGGDHTGARANLLGCPRLHAGGDAGALCRRREGPGARVGAGPRTNAWGPCNAVGPCLRHDGAAREGLDWLTRAGGVVGALQQLPVPMSWWHRARDASRPRESTTGSR